MAPKSRRTPHVELREPEHPQPLRIIKQRHQTVASCSAPREIEYRRRGSPHGSGESRGSPPMTIDRPLTVYKRRGGRGSVLNGSFDEPVLPWTGSAISGLMKKYSEHTTSEDPDVTPKAKQVSRTMSAGAFLKSELCSLRSGKQSDDIHMSHVDERGTWISPPIIPERRLSKSKTFFFKLGHRKDKEPNSIKRVDSTTENTFIRRLSRSTNEHARSDSSGTDSIPFKPGSLYSLPQINRGDITDVVIDSRSSSYGSSLHSLSPGSMDNWSTSARKEFFLCPEIKITPEVSSVDARSTNIWVAVEVSGTLRLANDDEHNPAKMQEGRRNISGLTAGHLRSFGCLYSMRIELLTTRDAFILEVIGNLHESKTLYAGETHLILAKLRTAKVTEGTSHIRESSTSEEIMADLENHLGGAITSYLNVRLTYKHSGFLNYTRAAVDLECGTSSHTTNLQTEASAFIKRHNLESAWSPRTSREMNGPLEVNPLIKLIEMRLPSDKARDAIRRLADDREPIPNARRLQNSSDAARGTGNTVKVSVGSYIAAHTDSTVSAKLPTTQSDILQSTAAEAQTSEPSVRNVLKKAAEVDPARRIWTQMRKNSRGNRNYRTSISDGHSSNDSEDCSPSRLSSADTVDEERMKIKDIALRNKRSVGADTLKSFAPSVVNGKSGSIGGVGLGVGRSWWAGSNWW